MRFGEARDGVPLEDFLQQSPLGFCDDSFKRTPRFHESGFLSRRSEADAFYAEIIPPSLD